MKIDIFLIEDCSPRIFWVQIFQTHVCGSNASNWGDRGVNDDLLVENISRVIPNDKIFFFDRSSITCQPKTVPKPNKTQQHTLTVQGN